jgi:hypothetical protein
LSISVKSTSPSKKHESVLTPTIWFLSVLNLEIQDLIQKILGRNHGFSLHWMKVPNG